MREFLLSFMNAERYRKRLRNIHIIIPDNKYGEIKVPPEVSFVEARIKNNDEP